MTTDSDLYCENQLLRRKLRAFLTQALEIADRIRGVIEANTLNGRVAAGCRSPSPSVSPAC